MNIWRNHAFLFFFCRREEGASRTFLIQPAQPAQRLTPVAHSSGHCASRALPWAHRVRTVRVLSQVLPMGSTPGGGEAGPTARAERAVTTWPMAPDPTSDITPEREDRKGKETQFFRPILPKVVSLAQSKATAPGRCVIWADTSGLQVLTMPPNLFVFKCRRGTARSR